MSESSPDIACPQESSGCDLLDAIATIRRQFECNGMEAPAAILLGSHDDGVELVSAIRRERCWVAKVGSPSLGHPVRMADGSVWMELRVMDVAVRWPANRRANPDGSWNFL